MGRSSTAAGSGSRTASSRRSAPASRRRPGDDLARRRRHARRSINTHHHLYQTLTRARAQEADLFTWLQRALSACGRGIDAEAEYAAARTGLAELALSGCTTVFDHHYVFPRGAERPDRGRDRRRRASSACSIVASRGSMDLGESDGGLPPDSARRGTRRACSRTPSGSPGCTSRAPELASQLAVAPCSPFSVTTPADGRSRRSSRGGSGSPLPHAPGGDGSRRRRTAWSSTAAARSSTSSSSAGSPATSGARTASTSSGGDDRAASAATGHRRRALPDVEPAPRRRGRAGAVPARCAARRVGLGVDGSASNERGDLLLRGQAGAARGARPRRPAPR